LAIIIKKDGRTVRTGKDYTIFRVGLWMMQYGRCKKCNRLTNLEVDIESDWSFHVHHVGGRGMGSSKRDDTTEDEKCIGWCGRCHRREHEKLDKGAVEKVESV
jgi:hypothetical protein